ncbi:hypothetical protein M3J09_012531 [Ascochyta lentis]
MLRCSAVRKIVHGKLASTEATAIRGYCIAGSSQLHPTLDQENTHFTTRSLKRVPPRNGEVNVINMPEVTNVKKVLWQPSRPATSRISPDTPKTVRLSKQPSASSANVESHYAGDVRKSPRNNLGTTASTCISSKLFQPNIASKREGKAYGAMKLLEEYGTPELALQALEALYEDVKTTNWDRAKRLHERFWRNSIKILDAHTMVQSESMFYTEQRSILLRAAYEGAKGVSKLFASHALRDHMFRTSTQVKMRPFLEHSRFLDWLSRTLPCSPHQKLDIFGSQLQVLSIETSKLIRNFVRIRSVTNSPDSYERRHKIVKYAIWRHYEATRATSEGLWRLLGE